MAQQWRCHAVPEREHLPIRSNVGETTTTNKRTCTRSSVELSHTTDRLQAAIPIWRFDLWVDFFNQRLTVHWLHAWADSGTQFWVCPWTARLRARTICCSAAHLYQWSQRCPRKLCRSYIEFGSIKPFKRNRNRAQREPTNWLIIQLICALPGCMCVCVCVSVLWGADGTMWWYTARPLRSLELISTERDAYFTRITWRSNACEIAKLLPYSVYSWCGHTVDRINSCFESNYHLQSEHFSVVIYSNKWKITKLRFYYITILQNYNITILHNYIITLIHYYTITIFKSKTMKWVNIS